MSCGGGLEPTSWCLPGMPGWAVSTSVWTTEPYTDAPACRWSSFHSSASVQFGSVQFSRSFVSDSLRPHRLQHTKLPSPSPTSRVCSNSCPSCWQCHPTISSSDLILPLTSIFPASGSFPMSQLFASGGQSIGASTSASVLPVNIQD